MTTPERIKTDIEQALRAFDPDEPLASADALFQSMRYFSQRRLPDQDGRPERFLDLFNGVGVLNPERGLYTEWNSAYFLFQLTGAELAESAQQRLAFDSVTRVDNTLIESYGVVVVCLQGEAYSRTRLAQATREINRVFRNHPVLVLFAYGGKLTLAAIHRRLHKRDESRDVLEKVTLIKDIRAADPHRAHIEILHDLALPTLREAPGFSNFVELHQAWQKALDSSVLNKRFYREIANWYFWAQKKVKFPKGAGKTEEERNAVSLIRLLTRLIFVWFIKEKGLVPNALFDKRRLDEVLKYDDPQGSTYYKAILQNLFFATLNTEMNSDKRGSRKFRGQASSRRGRDQNYMIHNVYRYQKYFSNPQAALSLFESVPFLNGGLFECLDKSEMERVDGFSERKDNELKVPDELFFAEEQTADLSGAYGDERRRREKVRGLLRILEKYKFTVDENTPIEEEVALDPELLGRVFENLLAAYNPETGVTARKQTGSFYTPREIVNYMVDEALLAYLENRLSERLEAGLDMEVRTPPQRVDLWGNAEPAQMEMATKARELSEAERENMRERLRDLLSYNDNKPQFDEAETRALIGAIDSIKVLDPACGSGAFPMGVLHKLVYLLSKLDPGNVRWRQQQVDKVERAIRAAQEIDVASARDTAVRELQAQADNIREAFEGNELDYARKLYLIENCIYGVDIQPIAVQIAKLRCFISLVVDQRVEDSGKNRGVIPLPNLETRFVAANTLIGLERPPAGQGINISFGDQAVQRLREQLADIRHRMFSARTPETKRKLRDKDTQMRQGISDELKASGWQAYTAQRIAEWDPYDHNASAEFFDPEWMFGQPSGFDIVIGNPPYVRVDAIEASDRQTYRGMFTTAVGKYDLYYLFFEIGLRLVGQSGTLSYITPNKFCAATSAATLRNLMLNSVSTQEIVSTSLLGVFEDAANYPVISLLSNSRLRSTLIVREALSLERLTDSTAANYQISRRDLEYLPDRLIPINVSQDQLNLALRLLRAFGPLGEYMSISEGLRIPSSLERQSKAKYGIVKQFQFEKWTPIRDGTFISEADLGQVVSKSSDRFRKIVQDKILIAEDALEITATIDRAKYVPQGGVYFGVALADWKPLALLAILNSALMSFLYRVLFGGMHMGAGYLRFRTAFLERLPLPTGSDSIREYLTEKADRILATKKANLEADVSKWVAEVDRMVYKLYGLTKEDIEIVEEQALP